MLRHDLRRRSRQATLLCRSPAQRHSNLSAHNDAADIQLVNSQYSPPAAFTNPVFLGNRDAPLVKAAQLTVCFAKMLQLVPSHAALHKSLLSIFPLNLYNVIFKG